MRVGAGDERIAPDDVGAPVRRRRPAPRPQRRRRQAGRRTRRRRPHRRPANPAVVAGARVECRRYRRSPARTPPHAVNSAGVPTGARYTAGRRPVVVACRSTRWRSASKRSGPAVSPEAAVRGLPTDRPGRRHRFRFGEVGELAEPGERRSPMVDVGVAPGPHGVDASVQAGRLRRRHGNRRWPRSPGRPPRQRRASSSVSRSTYHEPPAGSMTRATWDSSASTDWVLRASRRPRSLGTAADRASWGSTVIASAPPTAAAKQAIVARSMFTAGA